MTDGGGASRVPLEGILRLDEFEPLARGAMDAAAYAYYAGGAGDEITLRENRAAFERYRLLPRVLVDVSSVDPSTSILGIPVSMPIGIAPNAAQHLADKDAECATARAAASAGTLMCLSTFSSRSMEEVAAAADGPKWFQLYVHKDRGVAKSMIERAAASGYRAIVVTVDVPVAGYRERELRTPFRQTQQQAFGNLPDDARGKSILELLDGLINAAVTWDDLSWIKSISGLPLVVKGVLSPDDAVRCVEHGADGIVVSNHGGRQLDRVPAAVEMLGPVVDAVGGRAEVYLDGGVRRGTDVVTALALGARAVFIGRPYLFALALDGQDGVELCLGLIRAELSNALALVGADRVDRVDRSHLL